MNYKFAEKFISINGEGRNAGELSAFLRFSGCNLKCSYCDTMWVNEEGCKTTSCSTEEILEYLKKSGVKRVTITGGEPLLQEGVAELFLNISRIGIAVEVETNGSVSLEPFKENKEISDKVSFTMDYKMPSSDMEKFMDLENLSRLTKIDTLKLVCGSKQDLEKILELISMKTISDDVPIYISPVFGEIDGETIVDFMIKNKLTRAKLQLQLHKFIWNPEERGV